MQAEQRTVYEFGAFTLECYERRLSRRDSGAPIQLTAKAFDTLLHLIENRGQTLNKEALLRAIWPGLVVEENNLTQTISTLRQALGEARGENRFIATVPREGYRFVAAVVRRDAHEQAAPAEPPPAPAVPVARGRRTIWAGALLVVLLIAAAVFVFRPAGQPATPLSSTPGGTRDSAAFLLYGNGRYALARSDEQSLALAVDYFEKAIARDPRFALAHARLAEAWSTMGVFGMRAPADTFPRARDAALMALKLEPRLAPAYATLGHIRLQYDRDWDGAEESFRRAIELDPTISEPHLYLGVLHVMRGDLDPGLAELERAEALEPLLTLSKTRRGSMFYFARRYREAEIELKESLALDERPGIAHRTLGRVYLHTGRYELALAEFAQSRGVTPGSYADVANALALSGRRSEAVAELDRVLGLAKRRYVSAVDIAAIYAGLGDTENTLTWLDRALEQRAAALGFIAQNPAFDGLHRDPRFVNIVERIGVWKRPLTP